MNKPAAGLAATGAFGGGAAAGPTVVAVAAAAQRQRSLLQRADADSTSVFDNFSHLFKAARVGPENVVQVVTDNASNCQSMGKMVEMEYCRSNMRMLRAMQKMEEARQTSRKNILIGRVSTLYCGVQRASTWRHNKSRINRSAIFWSVRASFTSDNGLGSSTLESEAGSVGTRLSKVLLKRQTELVGKFNEGRKKLPTKIFLVLLGFYAANALATILGQTGDWDVLVAGIVVAIIELIGTFMYQEKYLTGRFKGFVIMLNYWKAGFTLGLFVDAFKVGS